MPTIKIKTGDVSYELKNEHGEHIGTITFNPADYDIIRRAETVEKWFSEFKVKPGVTIDEFLEFTDKVKEQFDYLCNRSVSSDLFTVCNPLTILADGTFYFQQILEIIIDLVRTEVTKRMKASEKRVEAAVAEITGDE